jgi:glycine cleavage system H protein
MLIANVTRACQWRIWLKNGLLCAVTVALAIMALLLLAALMIALRPLLMIGAIVAVLASFVLAVVSPRFRDWLETVDQPELSYQGLRLATNVAVHPSHSWVRRGAKYVVVGADDLVQATLGPVQAVELPPLGSRIEQGGRLLRLRRDDRTVELRAPVSGTVVATNQTLLARPDLVNTEPFAGGWAVRLRPDNYAKDRQRLLRGKRARGWFRREIDRLLATVVSHGTLLPSLPDGGTLVDELYRQIDDQAWATLTETFFGP